MNNNHWAGPERQSVSGSGESRAVGSQTLDKKDLSKQVKSEDESVSSVDNGFGGFGDYEVKPISVNSMSASSFGEDDALPMEQSDGMSNFEGFGGMKGSNMFGEQNQLFKNLRTNRGQISKFTGSNLLNRSKMSESMTASDLALLKDVGFSGVSGIGGMKASKNKRSKRSRVDLRQRESERSKLMRNMRMQREKNLKRDVRNHDRSLERLKKESEGVDQILENAYSKVSFENQVEWTIESF